MFSTQPLSNCFNVINFYPLRHILFLPFYVANHSFTFESAVYLLWFSFLSFNPLTVEMRINSNVKV